MRSANPSDGLGRILGKADLRVGTEERKGFPAAQVRPDLLKPHRRATMSLGPHQGYHFAEGTNLSIPLRSTIQHLADNRGEAPVIRPPIDNEPVQGLLGIEEDEPIL